MSQQSISLISELINVHPLYIILAIVWSLVWKGLALWRSAELKQKYWFVAILVVNTLGILEIIYLLVIARKYKVEYKVEVADKIE